MCTFITAVLPKSVDVVGRRDLINGLHVAFTPTYNKFIMAQLDPNSACYLTGHMCDCGTVLGCLQSGDARSSDHDQRRARKIKALRKKGWSQTKIELWLSEKHKMIEREDRKKRDTRKEREDEAARWIRFVQDVLHETDATYLGILLHEFRGFVETERWKIADRVECSLPELDGAYLMNMQEDVFHKFVVT